MRVDSGCFSSVQSVSRVQLFATPWTAARQASLSITNSQSSPKLIKTLHSVYWHLIICNIPFGPFISSLKFSAYKDFIKFSLILLTTVLCSSSLFSYYFGPKLKSSLSPYIPNDLIYEVLSYCILVIIIHDPFGALCFSNMYLY